METASNDEKLDYFLPLFVAAEIVGLLSVLLIFYWCVSYAHGFGLSGTPLFQWHPLLMTIGFIYLLGNGILIYRILRNTHKYKLKLMHTVINGTGLVFVLLAALAVIVNHNQSNIGNFYSLHSWIGIIAIALYLVQACLSIFAFLLDGFSNAFKALLLPYHVYFGHVIFVLGICAAVSGINEKAIFKLGDNYQLLQNEALLLNFTGVLFVIFGALIVYMTTNVYYKRYPRPEDSVLLERNRD